MRLAYLYSRYPVLSQTFCDTEMLALEQLGFSLTIGSIHPPLTSIRHAHAARLQAPIQYAPPQAILRLWEEKARAEERWPEALIARHDREYGDQVKAGTRARNATYFAELFTRNKIDHFHVHFANRAAHTALFLKALANIPFSITAHGQDFMADLGNDNLLREICGAAEFVAVETDYSRGLMAQRCPESAIKIHRVYNGMNLANFIRPVVPAQSGEAVRILSVGRLVAFKGFEYLIEACEQLRQRGVNFRCEIIGDGPLRESLQRRIDELRLETFVALKGAYSQDHVIERLQHCDVFALASTIDHNGASDIFPTVILEAMASARPVVSTTLAGIPEAVLDKETGLLVPAGDSALLAEALETLCRSRELRARFGSAGRARIENHFQVKTTVQPLVNLFATLPNATKPVVEDRPASLSLPRVAYLIDVWPDAALPSIETELLQVQKRNPDVTVFVCEFATDCKLTAEMRRTALHIKFLPDAMAIEAEWQANRELVLALEENRANESARVPVDIFLRQARFAIALRRMLRDISHVHAASSNALICGVLLQRLIGVTLSASIEAKPALSREVIVNTLQHAVGGRVADRKLCEHLGNHFVFDRAGSKHALERRVRRLSPLSAIDLGSRSRYWQEWAGLLDRWSSKA